MYVEKRQHRSQTPWMTNPKPWRAENRNHMTWLQKVFQLRWMWPTKDEKETSLTSYPQRRPSGSRRSGRARSWHHKSCCLDWVLPRNIDDDQEERRRMTMATTTRGSLTIVRKPQSTVMPTATYSRANSSTWNVEQQLGLGQHCTVYRQSAKCCTSSLLFSWTL